MISTDTLRKLKLVQDMTLSLPIEQEDFVSRLASATESGSSGVLPSIFNPFRIPKKEFTGDVGPGWFSLRRSASPFSDSSLSLVKVAGTVVPTQEGCLVELELNGLHPLLYLLYSLLLIFYAVIVVMALNSRPMLLVAALLHASTIGVLPYLLMRRILSRMKHYLERELFFLTKKAA